MRHSDSWAQAQPLRQFFDHLSDAVLLLDRQGRLVFANTSALRVLPCEMGAGVEQWEPLLGEATVGWMKHGVASLASSRTALRMPFEASRNLTLADGRRVQIAWQALDELHSVLRLQFSAAEAAAPAAASTAATVIATDNLAQLLWRSPFPATLQDADYRIVEVNPAYVEFTGLPRERLIGTDPLDLQPEEDRAANRAARPRLLEEYRRSETPRMIERRLVDASGRER